MPDKEIGTKKVADPVSGEKSVIRVTIVEKEVCLSLAQESKGEIQIRLAREDTLMLIKWLEKASLLVKYGF